MTRKQVNTVLSLVSIPENGDTKWWKHYNFIQNIHDGRGFTVSIVGFCTGTGDFIQVLQNLQQINPSHTLVKYVDTVKDKTGDDTSGLEGLEDDVKKIGNEDHQFNKAVWNVIQTLYWDPAIDFCDKRGMKSALAKYIVYDTLLNIGSLDAFQNIPGKDEKEKISSFLDIKHNQLQSGKFGSSDDSQNRVGMQKKLLSDGNFDLKTPMHVQCYGEEFDLK